MNFDFSFFPILETERLLMRQLTLEDTKIIFKIRTDKTINKLITRKIPVNLSEASNFIQKTNKSIQNNHFIFWGITTKGTKDLIGTVCLWNFSHNNTIAEIGYELLPEFHKNGFANETLTEILDFGFSILKLKIIEAFTHKNNLDSQTLLKKHSFIYLPERKDKDVADNLIFVLKKKVTSTLFTDKICLVNETKKQQTIKQLNKK